MNFNINEKKVKEYVQERFLRSYPETSNKKFNEMWYQYKDIPNFAPDGNVFEIGYDLSDEVHLIVRLVTQFYTMMQMQAMKIDLTDPNVAEDLSSGNIGTFGRISKVMVGYDTHDDTELGSGRWMRPIRLAKFPNTSKERIPITKEVTLVSNCSHHFISFNSLSDSDSKVIISYIPDKFVLGISKLSRLVNYISRRFYLQEDLTRKIYEAVSNAAETESVYVGLFNIVHGCEKFRGAQDNNGKFTSEYYGGDFHDPEIRKQVKGNK